MFLCEVALGKEHGITRDDSSLKAAPQGFDSVVAKGRTEPGMLTDFELFLHVQYKNFANLYNLSHYLRIT